MRELSSQEWHEAVRKGLAEVDRRLESGELDGSGRFYTDEELARGAATGRDREAVKPAKAPAPKAPAA